MIEAAGAAHAAALALIHAGAFPPGARWGVDAMGLQLGLPGVFGLIDSRGGMVLARVAADESEVLTLGVVPAARRCGVGRGLMAAAMARAAAGGAAAMLLEVGAGNEAGLGLYGLLGFLEVGRRRGYYGAGRDALVLRAELPTCSWPGVTISS